MPQKQNRIPALAARTVNALKLLVLNKMAAAGIPQDRLVIVQAVGESKPLIPTADGVKEAGNRVVEIDLRMYNQ